MRTVLGGEALQLIAYPIKNLSLRNLPSLLLLTMTST